MPDKTEVLERFDSLKLIDIAKNYRQYGYEEEIRLTATKILEDRGIGETEIEIAGCEKSGRLEMAQRILNAFGRSSRLAFGLYLFSLFFLVLSSYLAAKYPVVGTPVSIFYLLISFAFILAEIKSFIDWRDFYEAIGKKPDTGEQVVFFLLGMPLYIFFYFYYRAKMREDIAFIE